MYELIAAVAHHHHHQSRLTVAKLCRTQNKTNAIIHKSRRQVYLKHQMNEWHGILDSFAARREIDG